MRLVKSMLIAFSMYSRIPVRGVEWNEDNMRFSLCFVPLIGLFAGVVNYAFWLLCRGAGISGLFFGCMAAVIPILITGGIHMDGFCDTVDAAASCRVTEKRLEILKDPHIGSFAVIMTCCYFLLLAGSLGSVSGQDTMLIIMLTYVLSRCIGCFLAVTMKNARNEGTLFTFTRAADRAVVASVIGFIAVISGCITVMVNPLKGMFVILAMAISAVSCAGMAGRNFGGITGDITGFAIQVTELLGIMAAVAGEFIWNLL